MPLLMSHDTKTPIGIFTKVQEDATGLYVEGELNLDIIAGKEAYSLLRQGALTGLSIAFIADDYVLNRDGSRTITKATLVEISLTPIPAQAMAQVTSVRSVQADEPTEDWECILTALRGFVNTE
jgi:HK97 family phage prohead protease